MKSKIGSIILLIDGIIYFLFFIPIFWVFINFVGNMIGGGSNFWIIMLLLAIIFIAFGVARFICYKMMKNPEKTMRGGIIAIVIGALTFDILAIIGGIIGVVQGSNDVPSKSNSNFVSQP